MFSQLNQNQTNPKRSGPRQGFKIKISGTEILKCTFYRTEPFVIFTFGLKQNGLEHVCADYFAIKFCIIITNPLSYI